MNPVMQYLIVIGATFAFSIFSSVTARKGFSMNVFLASLVVCISVLVWKSMLPFYAIIFAGLIIIGILFSDKIFSSDGGTPTDE